MGDFRIKVIWESGAPDEKTVAISGYTGHCGCVHVPAQYEGIDAFAVAARAFEGNADVCEVSIPEPIYSLGVSCFKGCSKLKRVSLPRTLKVIGASAFRECTALEEVIMVAPRRRSKPLQPNTCR